MHTLGLEGGSPSYINGRLEREALARGFDLHLRNGATRRGQVKLAAVRRGRKDDEATVAESARFKLSLIRDLLPQSYFLMSI